MMASFEESKILGDGWSDVIVTMVRFTDPVTGAVLSMANADRDPGAIAFIRANPLIHFWNAIGKYKRKFYTANGWGWASALCNLRDSAINLPTTRSQTRGVK
jgi:hypothetical protein